MSGKERRPLTREEINELKERLLKRKEELWETVRETLLHEIGDKYQDVVQTIGDVEDLAKADLDEETIFEVLKARKTELEAISQALWQMEKGEYGRCLNCKRWIRFKRLQIRPWSSYCTDCKRKLELREA